MKIITKFACYYPIDSNERRTYRIVCNENGMYMIEQKSYCQNRWYNAFPDYVKWNTLQELYKSYEFRCLFNIF